MTIEGTSHARSGARALVGLLSTTTLAALIVSPARAQDDPGAATEGAEVQGQAQARAESQGEDQPIVVTATRRASSIEDVPVAITAFGGEQLEAERVRNLADLAAIASGLQISAVPGGQALISLRGVSSFDIGAGLEVGVAVYQDGEFLASPFERTSGLYDIDRVEVLKGPQGTLYGRNAIGGSINIVTNAPTDFVEMAARGSIGNYGLVEAEGFASGPVLDGLSARLAFRASSLEGYGENFYTGQGSYGNEQTSGRLSLRYEPLSDLTIDLAGDYSRTSSTYAIDIARYDPAQPLGPELLGIDIGSGFDVNHDSPNDLIVTTWGVRGRANWDLDFAELSSLTAYRWSEWNLNLDIDFTPLNSAFFREIRESQKFQQEVYLTSLDSDNFNWIVGGSYLHESATDFFDAIFPVAGRSFVFSQLVPEQKTDAYALFGEGTIRFLDRLSFTLGARYTYERKTLRSSQAGDFGAPFVIPFPDQRGSWDQFSPSASLMYELTDDVSAYARVARGFKSGGFRYASTDSFEPETVTNYELGLRGSFIDRRVNASLVAFWMDYSDLQVSAPLLGTTPTGEVIVNGVVVTNAASATNRGIEADFNARLTDRLIIDGNASYLDARFDEYLAFRGFTQEVIDASGNRLAGAPKWSTNLGVTYTIPVSTDWELSLRGSFTHQSDIFFTPFEDIREGQEAYSSFNARATLAQKERWSVSIWGQNLTNELVATYRFAVADPQIGRYLRSEFRPPRTYGVTISYGY